MIDLSSQGAGTIRLTGVAAADLDADDFVFAALDYTGTGSMDIVDGTEHDDTISTLGGTDVVAGGAVPTISTAAPATTSCSATAARTPSQVVPTTT